MEEEVLRLCANQGIAIETMQLIAGVFRAVHITTDTERLLADILRATEHQDYSSAEKSYR